MSQALRIGVVGATGRMGREVCATVFDDPDLVLAAAIGRSTAGLKLGELIGRPACDLVVTRGLDQLTAADVDVAVDFTHPQSVVANVRWYIEHGLDAVVGTTGIADRDLDEIRTRVADSASRANLMVAPNFSIGAVLMIRFAAVAARHFPDVEIVERYGPTKAEAPGGTALLTAAAIAEARRGPASTVESLETTPGVRGATIDGVRVHAIRLPGSVAHQEVLFGGRGQSLRIAHDAFDRGAFMPGVILAIKRVSRLPGLTVGIDRLIGL